MEINDHPEVTKIENPLTQNWRYWKVMASLFFFCSVIGGTFAYFWSSNDSKILKVENKNNSWKKEMNLNQNEILKDENESSAVNTLSSIDLSEADFVEGKKKYESAIAKLQNIDKVQDPQKGLEIVEQSIIELEKSRELMFSISSDSQYYNASRGYISYAEKNTQTANGWKKAFIEKSLITTSKIQSNLNRKRKFPDLSIKNKNNFVAAMKNQSVALTFDDGPTREYTPRILEILNKNNVKATFFVVGKRVRENCDILRAIYQSGHEIGNHTDTHPYLTKINQNQQIKEIKNLQTSVDQCLGFQYQINWFRAPYGDQNSELVETVHKLGFNSAQWIVDTHDWKKTTSSLDMQNTVMEYKNPGVILMHDGSMTNPNFQHPNENPSRQNTVDALQPMINSLKNRGFNFVNLSGAVP